MTTDMAAAGTIHRSQIVRVVISVVIVAAATALGMWAHFANPDTKKYRLVLVKLAADQLQVEKSGRIDLTAFPGLTPHDEMFVTRHRDGSFLGMFPTYYGKGVCIAGLLYTSQALRDGDTYIQVMGGAPNRDLIDVATWKRLIIDKRLDEHWYMVSRGLH